MDIDFRLDVIEHNLEALIQRGQGRIFTFSAVVGTSACDASCPFCVSKTTGFKELPKRTNFNAMRLRKAARLAQMRGATTLLLTGKGEPTLYPDDITAYLQTVEQFNFPIIELQTNALQIGQIASSHKVRGPLNFNHLMSWLSLGLNTIAISVVDVDMVNNAKVYSEQYINLATTVRYLHDIGYSVRLCVMMQKGMIDSPKRLSEVISWCREHAVEQLTVRPIRRPEVGATGSQEYMSYIKQYGLEEEQVANIREWVKKAGKHILTIAFGAHAALVYDIEGQNICVSDCLTVDARTDDIRTLIYYPSGRITFDWQYEGAVIM